MNKGILCNGVSFAWTENGGDNVLENLSFSVPSGSFVSVIGPSGCGKSSLLYLLSGLKMPTAGTILVDGRIVTGPDRSLGLVFQDYSLFPWLTVLENTEFGLKLAGASAKDRTEKSLDTLQRVGLLTHKAKYPHELSGGMQQRVAVARALANESDYLLMDEPFGALDLQTRARMQQFVLEIWHTYRKTVIFVTHQVDEAVLLSDRIMIMGARPGRIVVDHPIRLSRPRDANGRAFNEIRMAIATDLMHEVEALFASQPRDP